jgi:hypothetical protein
MKSQEKSKEKSKEKSRHRSVANQIKTWQGKEERG